MKLEVGIYFSEAKSAPCPDGWKMICDQEKVPHKFTDQPDCPVIVCEGSIPNWLPDFMDAGGVGILTGCNAGLLPFKTDFVSDAALEFIDLTELGASIARVACLGSVFNGKGLGKIAIHERRITKSGITQDEFPVFIFQEYGQGGCWYSGLPLTRLLLAVGDTLREVQSLDGFTERIVSIDKHHIIKALRNLLIRSFNYRKLPYVHLWYYPGDYQSVFAFRIDVDGIFGNNLKKISDAALANGFELTFFLNKSLCKQDEALLREIDPRHEIGSHADIHNLFSDFDSNFTNIKNSMEWLESLPVKHGKWFAAPRGMWNFNLHRALEELGYPYTSDFGCAIAGFPFYPFICGRRSKTLQIPVNPFSVERSAIWLEESQQAALANFDIVKRNFSSIIHENYPLDYPIMLYSHPEKFGAMADSIFQQLRQEIDKLNVWVATVSQFSDWWAERDTCDFEADFNQDSRELRVHGILNTKFSYREIFL